MINKTNPNLAINGGTPVSKEPIIIHKPYLAAADRQALLNAFDSTFISGDGPACREFESKLARYLGVQHALYVNSATSALELAFRVKDFPPGAEVIVPDFTYTSSALGPLYNNLKVVLCDVYPDNGSIDVGKLESYITDKTVAIVPVDYAGIPADMGEVNRIAQIHGLYVVHDTAQSLGAEYKGRKTGSLADLSTFSFHGTKNITTGEGGAITTNDSKLAERIKILREKGTNKYSFLTDNITRGYYEYVDIGNSYVQSNLLGALGASQMRSIGHICQARREIAEYYLQELDGLPGLDFLRHTPGGESNWHIFGILVPPEDKYWVLDALRAEGVYANVHYTPLHQNSFYKNHGADADFPGAVKLFKRLLRLPIYPDLTHEEREAVVTAVIKIFGRT
ncbi:MAG: DegT/DnrJ/EryC1/StrS family aminotransferase [Candidatus Cloacimonetes bacterium]|nr:DegT/DnrJ/EryC1/StrS family aminotransferase [Candidatus Cloacimonadota bacterium]